MTFHFNIYPTNGKLVVWAGGLGFSYYPLSHNPFHKEIPGIKTTNLPQ